MKNGLLLETSLVAMGGVIIPIALTVPAHASNTYTVAPGETSVVSGEITSNVSGVTINGGGTVVFTNTSNTYSHETTISGGSTLAVTSESVLGDTQGITLGDSVDSGTLSYNQSGYQITSDLTDAHGLLINAGGGVIVTNSGTVVSATSGGATVTSNYIADLAGVVSGVGQLTVTGGGTLELSGQNVWTGGTLVEDGSTLEIGKQYNLGADTNTLTLDSGTVAFDLSRPIVDPISVGPGGGTFNVQGHHDILSGTITGPGSLTISDNEVTSTTSGSSITTGTLTLVGTEAYTGGTVVDGGKLVLDNATLLGDATVTSHYYSSTVLSGSGTSAVTSTTSGIIGGVGTVKGTLTVENGGEVSPGTNGSGTLSVGNYVQNSGTTLLIGVGSGSFSQLDVAGNASLAGNLTLQYQGFASPGTYQYLKAGSTTGAFNSITDDLESAGMKSDVEGDSVTLTQNSALPSGDLPAIYAATTNVAVDEAQFTNRLLLDRLQSARTTALAQREQAALSDYHEVRNLSPYGLWVAPLGGFGSASGADGAPGYSTSKYGMVIGYDQPMAPGWVTGGAIEYTHQNITQTGGGTARMDTPRIAVYTGFWRGPYAVDLTASDGPASISTKRPLTASLTNVLNGVDTTQSFSETASGKRSANELAAALQASANYLIGYTWAVSPAVGVKFARASITGVNESGTDYFDYTINKQDINSIRPFVNVQGSRRYYFESGAALLPSVTLGVEDEVGTRNRDLEARTSGDDYVWTIPGVKPSSLAIDVNLGIAYETSKTQSFGVKLMGTEASGDTEQTILAQYGLRF